MPPVTRFGSTIRDAFPLERDITFLNNGSFGASPHRVLAAQARWRERLESQPVRFMIRELPGALREAAGALARFVGSEPRNLGFVDNATTGVNTVLRSIAFREGDEVLACSHVYPAVRNAMRHVAERAGARYVEAPV